MKKKENHLTINSWYKDIQVKGFSLRNIPENERTLEMCFVAIHYWGAALEYVPEKYKTYEFCLDAIRHNTPVDEGYSALAFVPEEHKTYELCLEAIRHDYLISAFWEPLQDGHFQTVEPDYSAAINFVPQKLRTPELCFEAIKYSPSSPPGYFNFVEPEFENEVDDESIWIASVEPKNLDDIMNSSELFMKSLKLIGMPEEYNEEALKYFEKIKNRSITP